MLHDYPQAQTAPTKKTTQFDSPKRRPGKSSHLTGLQKVLTTDAIVGDFLDSRHRSSCAREQLRELMNTFLQPHT